MTELLAAWLQDSYDVCVANRGDEALTLASHAVPDVALIDIMMPSPDGFAIAEEFRRHPRLASTRVIFITGLERPANAARAAELGAVDLLYKPLDYDRVRACVKRALELKQAH
jgi:two-component system, sensor histidine kinase and response regulator